MDVCNTFTAMHNEYFEKWNHAMKSGDTKELEKLMSADYHVTFFIQNQDKPFFFDREEAVEGMRQSVSSHKGHRKRFEHRVIQLRDAENAVVFYEQMIKTNEETVRLFTVEDWRYKEGVWKIVREIQEHI